ncbi:adenosylcobinamide-GDP ribazoletransferase [Methanococcus voltae]|uniref:Adenosylcobinamide-GDP ribazoletransferase n=1 Tax=Methanococcus voltae (strain ATCC BAA-1334 / A3) TaxID=456320 RepID=D7DTT6_METV3|nr:adenosylcobinamide-GDP ribazoletransferase [Methanococcus voltae]MCS3900344.1 adenosylcobinamide-GDP ribazoletransferase [Methanococcus voltae]
MLQEIKALIAFMTKIPISNITCGFEDMAKYFWVMPLIGTLIGVFGALIAYGLHLIEFSAPLIASIIILCTLLYMQGFHHVDGLGDYGDAWMVMGTKRKKLDVMKDVNIGIGGIMFLLLVELTSIFAIAHIYSTVSIFEFMKYIILVETCSRLVLLACATCGIPATEGTGRYLVKKSNEMFLLIGLLTPLALGYLLGAFKIAIMLATVSAFFGMYFAWNSNKKLGCVTGDILGASVELSRALLLVLIIALAPAVKYGILNI